MEQKQRNQQLEQEKRKKELKNARNNILLFVLKIFEHPFILLSLIILGILIWMFMGALDFGFFKAVGFSIIIFIVLVGIFFRLYKINFLRHSRSSFFFRHISTLNNDAI